MMLLLFRYQNHSVKQFKELFHNIRPRRCRRRRRRRLRPRRQLLPKHPQHHTLLWV